MKTQTSGLLTTAFTLAFLLSAQSANAVTPILKKYKPTKKAAIELQTCVNSALDKLPALKEKLASKSNYNGMFTITLLNDFYSSLSKELQELVTEKDEEKFVGELKQNRIYNYTVDTSPASQTLGMEGSLKEFLDQQGDNPLTCMTNYKESTYELIALRTPDY